MKITPYLMPRPLAQWLRRFFHGALEAIGIQEAAAMKVDTLDWQSKVFQKAMELNHQIKAYRESEDPSERQLAEEFSGLMHETLHLGKAMLAPMTAEERTELSRPLSTASDGSLTSSPPEGPAALKSLEDGTPGFNGTTQEPPRRPVGRPKGSKNKPKPPSPNGTNL